MIYLDFPATTPMDAEVGAAMRPYMNELFGNPHSDHAHGLAPSEAIDEAIRHVATLIGADPGEIVFTSGATEANNHAIKGVMRSGDRRGDHVVVSAIEHRCVLEAARSLRAHGYEVTEVPPGPDGVVRPDAIEAAIRPDTALVSLMLVNNEVGSRQLVREVAAAVRAAGAVMHTDAAQAVGKIPVDVAELGVHLLSLSGHKFYGPKGIGALYVSTDCPVRLEPLIYGGGQQAGRRGGTLPTFLCVGLGEAARIAAERMGQDTEARSWVAATFEAALRGATTGVAMNGPSGQTRGIADSYRFEGADAASVLQLLYGKVSASMGSACRAGSIEPSHVLVAMGLTPEQANQSIRFGFGRATTEDEARCAAAMVADAVEKARDLGM